MAVNSLYPGFIKLFYSANAHEHVQVLPCNPFQAVGGAWDVTEKGNPIGRQWVTSLTDYVTVFKAFLTPTSTVLRGELWTMDSPTASPLFRESNNFGVVGTGGASAQVYGQQTITFRSTSGGRYKNVILEGSTGVNTEVFPPFTGGVLAFSNYLIGATSLVCARDGGWLNSPIRLLTKTNDTLRKKYLLDA